MIECDQEAEAIVEALLADGRARAELVELAEAIVEALRGPQGGGLRQRAREALEGCEDVARRAHALRGLDPERRWPHVQKCQAMAALAGADMLLAHTSVGAEWARRRMVSWACAAKISPATSAREWRRVLRAAGID